MCAIEVIIVLKLIPSCRSYITTKRADEMIVFDNILHLIQDITLSYTTPPSAKKENIYKLSLVPTHNQSYFEVVMLI